MNTLIIARVVLVIFSFMFVIGLQKRKRLFTVKKADAGTQHTLIESFLKDELRDNRLLLLVSGVFTALALAFVVYTLYVPAVIK